MQISRRGLLTGLVSFVAAPAIVRASSLMPVKAARPSLVAVGDVSSEEWIFHTQYRQEYVEAYEQTCGYLRGDTVHMNVHGRDFTFEVVDTISSTASACPWASSSSQ